MEEVATDLDIVSNHANFPIVSRKGAKAQRRKKLGLG